MAAPASSTLFAVKAGSLYNNGITDQRLFGKTSSVHLRRSSKYLQGRCEVSLASSGVRTEVATMKQANVAVVTGASKGIGKAIVLTLGSAAGCKILVNYATSSKEAEEVCKEIELMGGKAIAVGGDVTKEEDVASMLKTAVDAWGTIDMLLVNDAGTARDGSSPVMTLAQWNEVLDSILSSQFLFTKAVTMMMAVAGKGEGGSIDMGSVVCQVGNIGHATLVEFLARNPASNYIKVRTIDGGL